MTEFMEQPVLIAGLGILTAVILFSGWVKTGHVALLPAILVSILLFGGLLVAERMIKTDREQVRETLYEIVQNVEQNNIQEALQHIHSSAGDLKQQAENYLSSYNFAEAAVTQVQSVEVESKSNPPRARIEFTARARVQEVMDRRPLFRSVTVDMKKEGDRWRVFDYEHRPIQEAF